jgi:hypothetical protein
MDLATIEMPVDQAKARLEEYREQLKVQRTDQDERIAAGYRVLARGLPIIKLSESIERGGYFDNGLPKIAVARADSQDCWVHTEGPWNGTGTFIYSSENPGWRPHNRGALVNSVTVRVSVSNMPDASTRRKWNAHTIMPIIPPKHRPKLRRLRGFHLLWEVEEWELVPPKDPALLRWIGGDLWAVVAEWDLTELERAVLAR